MNLNDYYYKAFKLYKEETNNKLCIKDRDLYKKTGKEFDKFEVLKYSFIINPDWIIEIEKALPFIENAVEAERQFIRNDGEVVPIEKVRRVSKESVVHLARHSNLITRVVDDKDLIPDKIFMSERLTDFAVYENRVLYKILLYLKEFITLRLDNIEKLRKTYICDLYLNKEYKSKNRNLTYKVSFREENYLNEYPIVNPEQDDLIRRVKDIEQIVEMLLKTNLMQEVSKAPLVRDPIIKTNVLKMNNDFKNSLALYEYLTLYKGLGYESNKIIKKFEPFDDVISDEMASVASLLAYITYSHGNELEEILLNNYLEEEKKLEALREKQLDEKIKRLKKRVEESGKGIERYMVMLEQRNKELLTDKENLVKAREEISKLKLDIDSKDKEIYLLNDNIIKQDIKLKDSAQQIIDLKISNENNIKELNLAHDEEIFKLNNLNEAKIEEIKKDLELKENDIKEEVRKEYSEEINTLTTQIENNKKNYEDKNNELNNLIKEYDKSKNEYINLEKKLRSDYNHLEEENKLLKARLSAMKVKNNELKPDIEYTKEEEFKNIEEDYLAFNKFFKSQWKMTRKEIRKEIFCSKKEKKMK